MFQSKKKDHAQEEYRSARALGGIKFILQKKKNKISGKYLISHKLTQRCNHTADHGGQSVNFVYKYKFYLS